MRRAALALLLVGALGCSRWNVVADEVQATTPSTDPPPSNTPPSSDPPASSSCPWSGPPVLLDGTCTGVLSQRVFGRAACACGALSLGGDLVTDGFDSRVAPWTAGGAGGDVGALTGLTSAGLLDSGGSVAVSGAGAGLTAGSTLRVAGDLRVAGPLGASASTVVVGGSAGIGGDVSVSSLSVTGTLTTAPGAALAGTVTAGSWVTGAVSVPPACPCSAADAVDVAAIVAQHRTTNDDASIGLDPARLSSVAADVTVTLPCGRFYLDRIQGAAFVTLRATGHAALFVGAGVQLAGQLTIELAPDAELDLFVAGPVMLTATLRLGDAARPRALRLWLAASGQIGVPYGAQISANVYAPAAELVFGAPIDLYGAVMAGSVTTTAPVRIHHDRAIAGAASTCAP